MSLNVSAYSIRNPLVAILLFILLTLGGILGFKQMKVQQFPDIDLPAVVVTVSLPGAAPNQLENDVAKKIENRISSIEGIKHIRTTLQTGVATISSEFVLEKDIQEAVDDVRSAVGEVQADLPAAAEDPIVTKVTTAGLPAVTYTVTAPGVSVEDLSWFVDDTIDKRLSDIKGVSSVSRVGGLEREVRVAVDPTSLNALKLPITQLSDQVAGIQQDNSGGESKVGSSKQTIRVLGAVSQARELNDLQIALPTGGTQRLGEIARITDATADPDSLTVLDGNTVVAFNVSRSRGASEVEIVELVDAELEQLQKDMPSYTITKVFDRATPVAEDYEASLRMLIEGGILAVVVVFLFLRNVRATVVAAVALPLSVIPTFLGMYLFDFSLNLISLLALSLVVGVLVDDAIVEVENIMRHLRMGKTPYQAAMEAADEIGLAVIATTFTLIAVFLPTAFMSGVVGQFFRQFGWTAAIAIFASLLVARLITPMMAAYVLRPEKDHKQGTSRTMKLYLKTVAWTLKHRWLTMAVTLIMFAGSLTMVKLLPTAFIPENDIDQSRIGIELTPDASLADTTRIAKMVQQKVSQIDGVKSILSVIGDPQAASLDASSGGGGENAASMDIVLEPRGTRPSKIDIEREIADVLTEVPSARFDVGLSSGGESGYSFALTSTNANLLEKTAQQVMDEIRALPMAGSVTSNRSLPRQELSVIPDRIAMADLGATTQGVADTLRVATLGDYEQRLSKLNLDTRQVPIVVRLPDNVKDNVSQLGDLYVPSNGSSGARVSEVAQLEFGTGPAEIRRFDRERAITITAQVGEGELGELITAVKGLPSLQPGSLPADIRLIDQGQAESMAELFSGFVIAISIGIICIFGVLILLFGKVLQPLTILMALPLSIGGAFVGLVLSNSSLSMPSMIGFIMLMGIATKNSILLVDYAILAEREHGLTRFEALLDACRKRAQPIIMTTVAMGAGMLPLIFGLGDIDSTFRRPMAAAVLGGLVTSTLLSLIVIPMVYTFMDDISRWFAKWLQPHGKTD
ncbi:efflux RND transporter permease subunit [Psychrobacter sp. FDAARGOS_221]|uniref:efflux RND transporter permease subunit n=1 Tax=Psychrobacter sp. FDAARGOS_221 TaxID=1975705 RepID=UPI000BB5355E|nr:efflux RND transporter permease subunit [Psychrobacter sp. FDAARGOS_221]PNK60723.1 AcrB/AcrD/AcrF family protein [Psychrobacter sp. FDAARGOS_221]